MGDLRFYVLFITVFQSYQDHGRVNGIVQRNNNERPCAFEPRIKLERFSTVYGISLHTGFHRPAIPKVLHMIESWENLSGDKDETRFCACALRSDYAYFTQTSSYANFDQKKIVFASKKYMQYLPLHCIIGFCKKSVLHRSFYINHGHRKK